ncbi:Cof-type HAD-IIB family hydrolase [Candidatus Bipolaricaulota sp. J31]
MGNRISGLGSVPCLLVLDLDGTILGDDHRLSPDVYVALGRLSPRFWIAIATGRSLASATPFVLTMGITLPVILYNGAVVYDIFAGAALREQRLGVEEARAALAVTGRYPVDVEVYRDMDDPTLYVERITPRVARFQEKENLPAREVGDLLGFLNFPPLKLLVLGDPEVLVELEAELKRGVQGIAVVRSEVNYLEVLPRGASKGAALRWLSEHLGIPREGVVAVGDQLNDLEMIRWAGIGVAMAHGPAELRRTADLVISSVAELPRLLPR